MFIPPPTIFALSSAPGRAGVAVIRISGSLASNALAAIAGPLPPPRHAALRHLRHPKTADPLDHALVLWFPAPASFTGEDVVELHIHGGRAVIEAVSAALGTLEFTEATPAASSPTIRLRIAEPDEFTRRAFDNGKLDLTAVEGLADLIDAETEGQRQQALSQATGALAALYDKWRSELIGLLARIEAELDFSDEGDVPVDIAAQMQPAVSQLAEEIEAHLEGANRGEILREGFRVVLAGPPNAGKSSLLNALARRDAAIVSAEPGTTRDVIEVRLDLAGIPVVLTDTAGIRKATGVVEQEGIRRTMDRARTADLVLWLNDATEPLTAPPADLADGAAEVIPVSSKIDLLASPTAPPDTTAAAPPLAVSARTGVNLSTLAELIADRAKAMVGEESQLSPSRTRHSLELRAALTALRDYVSADSLALELRAEDLRQAAHALGRLTGRIDVEDVLDAIFSSFCIGK